MFLRLLYFEKIGDTWRVERQTDGQIDRRGAALNAVS